MKVVIIGTGRVGLPFALYLKSLKIDTIGVDNNETIVKLVTKGQMPFKEDGCGQILKKHPLKIYSSIKSVPSANYYVITVGTPLEKNLEPDLKNIINVLTELIDKLKKNDTIILRSTVSPGTTRFVKKFLNKKSKFKIGKDLFLAHCPERLAEGHALSELSKIPQILGSDDVKSTQYVKKLFAKIKTEIMTCSSNQAELIKLFLNSSRYLYFATINFLAMKSLNYNEDPYKIIELANFKYPRPITGLPGFTAGTCLRKDFGMISDGTNGADILTSAWRINESLPDYLVEYCLKNISKIEGKNILILGYTFKADSDDVRDSLVPKLINSIIKENPKNITISDPFITKEDLDLPYKTMFVSNYFQAIKNIDICFIGTNHSIYKKNNRKILKKLKLNKSSIVDIWNILGTNNIFRKI